MENSSRDRSKIVSACNKAGYRIYPIVENVNFYRLVIEFPNGNVEPGQKLFSRNPKQNEEKWYELVYQLYEYYYSKL